MIMRIVILKAWGRDAPHTQAHWGTKEETEMLGAAKVMTFLGVTDRARARAYYGGDLGLPLVEDGAYALVFDLNGIMLRISPLASSKRELCWCCAARA